jgi:hypothetical protein
VAFKSQAPVHSKHEIVSVHSLELIIRYVILRQVKASFSLAGRCGVKTETPINAATLAEIRIALAETSLAALMLRRRPWARGTLHPSRSVRRAARRADWDAPPRRNVSTVQAKRRYFMRSRDRS